MDNSDIAYVVEKLGEFIEPGRIMLVGARVKSAEVVYLPFR